MRLHTLLATLVATFLAAPGHTEEDHQQWIQYLTGTWSVTNLNDGTSTAETLRLTSGGKAAMSTGTFADGMDYSRLIYWEPDTETLLETWVRSDGLLVVNRYEDVTGPKLVGKTKLVNAKGEVATGTIVREQVSGDELTSSYAGYLPGEPGQVQMNWVSKRRTGSAEIPQNGSPKSGSGAH
jgi:hypothetical protein